MDSPPYELFSDSVPPVLRDGKEQLFMVRLEAVPELDNPIRAEFAGAFVVCSLDAYDLRSAERDAIRIVREEGWLPRRLDEWALVSKDNFKDAPNATFERALREGSGHVFLCWPPDAPDWTDNDA